MNRECHQLLGLQFPGLAGESIVCAWPVGSTEAMTGILGDHSLDP